MARKALSKRVRFEIFKRDGFRCVYCGATPLTVALHVDHVEPVAGGGGNETFNLVTACANCNLGKSAVPLERRAIAPSIATEPDHDHSEQIKEYLAVQKEIAKAKSALVTAVVEYWLERIGFVPEPEMESRFTTLVAEFGFARIMEAIDIVARKEIFSSHAPTARRKHAQYFHGILRRWREADQ